MPKVTVIIPCFNLGQYLGEAVDSVLTQTYQDFELIIVNDGSTDELTNILLSTYDKKPKIRVLTTENQGLPFARNNGVLISNGEYICCLDADDKYHSEFLEKTVEVLDNDQENIYGFVTTWMELFGEKHGILSTSDFNPYALAIANVVHVASLFRRICWDLTAGYPTNLSGYQDWSFWLSIVALGYEWACVHEPLLYYRVRPNSMIFESNRHRSELYLQIIENNRAFYDKFNNLILLNCLIGLDTKQHEIEVKDGIIDAKQHEIEVKDGLIDARQHEIDILKAEIVVSCNELNKCNNLVIKHELTIKNLESSVLNMLQSKSWRMTALFRWLRHLFLG